MAYAATSALVMCSGLVAVAAVGGFNVLGFGGQFADVAGAEGTVPTTAATPSAPATTPAPIYILKYQIVDDYVVVTTAAPLTTAAAAVAAAAAPAAAPTTPVTQAAVAASAPPAAYPAYDDFGVAPSYDDFQSPPTTAPASYSPPSSVAPEPPNCHDARLNRDGTWHCDDDGDD